MRGRVWVEKPELFMKCTTGEARPWGLLSDALISLFAPDRVIRRARKARHVRPPPVRRASSASRHTPRVPPTCRHVGEKPDSMHTVFNILLYSWNIFGRYDFRNEQALAYDKSSWKCRARLWKILNGLLFCNLRLAKRVSFIKFCQGKFLRLFDLEKRRRTFLESCVTNTLTPCI